MAIELPTLTSIAAAATLLRQGELVSFPTETVYGLGADARSDTAVRKIFMVKGRPSTNPLIVHGASLEILQASINLELLTAQQLRYFERLSTLWPAPLTIVVPASREISPLVKAGKDSVGIRIPNHPVALQLLNAFGGPVAAPSANKSNYISPTTAGHVYSDFGEEIPLIIDGGSAEIGIESTVISVLRDKPVILREGGISREELETNLGEEILTSKRHTGQSPGESKLHYAPHTPIKIGMSSRDASVDCAKVYFDKKALIAHEYAFGTTIEDMAANLYGLLRQIDLLGYKIIEVEACEATGIGSAVLDRLERAASSSG